MPEGVRLGGAYYEITVENREAIVKMAQAEAAAKKQYQTIAREAGVSAAAVERAHKQMAAASQQAAAFAKGAVSLAGGLAGVSSAAVLAERAISSIATSTLAAQQAQFALSRTYGTSAPQMAAFAKQFGDAIGRSTTDVMKAAVGVGTLTRSYGFSREKGQELIRMAADLAAVTGIELTDATQRLTAAMRGEAESAEVLGLVLNDDAVAASQLGAELRDQWKNLTDAEKAALRFAEAQKQMGERTGAAAAQGETAMGAFNRLNTAVDELGATLGSKLLPPAAAVADVLATMAENANKTVKELSDLSNLDADKLFKIGLGLAVIMNPLGIPAAITAAAINAIWGGSGSAAGASATSPSGQPYGPGMPITDTAWAGPNAAAAKADADAAAARAKAQRTKDLEDAQDAARKRAKAEIDAIDAEKKAKEQWYDEERDRIEARRIYQLEDIEARKKAAIEALNAEKKAALDAINDQIEQQERLKDARIAAAEAAAKAATAAIDAEKERLDEIREAEDRARADQRRDEDRARADQRRHEDRALTDARREQDRQRNAVQEAEIRRLETLTARRLRALDREADRARAASEERVRGIEAAADAEAERHRSAMQALDDEQDARLKVLDTQLDALDAAEKAEGAARRTADLTRRLADAQAAATAARGTGTPEQIAEARDELTRALRGGDETSIANARERLVKLAGQGAAAIKKADEDLADAQQALRDEGVDQQRDAEREKLKNAQDAIKEEIDARKRAEEDENRRRTDSLAADKETEQRKLDNRLEKIKTRSDAEKKASDELLADAKARFEADTEILNDRRQEEDRYRDDQRQAEDRFRDDERTAQDRFREDERQAQDDALAAQLQAVQDTLATERVETEAHFNGPNGTITQLRKATRDTEALYSERLAAATAAYDAERKAAERLYRNPEKTGLLDLLEAQRTAELNALEQSKTDWGTWATKVVEEINKVIAAIKAAGQAGTGLPGSDSRAAGSGKATSASSKTTTSGRTGRPVQGTVDTWINDAMDITGVGDDWIAGLHELVRLESGGDPHNQNPHDVIANGVNYGPAKGLLQMLQSTFEANRDSSLPGDIFDPVANAVAAIRYIKKRYGHVDAAVKGHRERGGYDSGNLFRWPTMTFTPATGERAWIAERRPEYLVGGGATAAMLAAGPGAPNYSTYGAWLASAHPGGGTASTSHSTTINASGYGVREVVAEIKREMKRDQLLRGLR